MRVEELLLLTLFAVIFILLIFILKWIVDKTFEDAMQSKAFRRKHGLLTYKDRHDAV